jgi:hypothetical protein
MSCENRISIWQEKTLKGNLEADDIIEGIEPFTRSNAEMDFLNSGSSTKNRIFQAFGVNPMIVGEIEGSNRAQAAVAEDNFASNVVNPLLELISQIMTNWLANNQDDEFAEFGTSDDLLIWIDPATAYDADLELARWRQLEEAGVVTKNEIRTNVGQLPPMDDPEFDMPISTLDAADRTENQISGKRPIKPRTVNPGSGGAEEQAGDGEEGKSLDLSIPDFGPMGIFTIKSTSASFEYLGKSQRETIWMSQHSPYENEIEKSIKSIFADQKDDVIDRFKNATKNLDLSSFDKLSSSTFLADKILPIKFWTDHIKETLSSSLISAATNGGMAEIIVHDFNQKSWEKARGSSASKPTRRSRRPRNSMPSSMLSRVKSSIGKSLKQNYWSKLTITTRKGLRKVIYHGIESGSSEKDLIKAIISFFDGMISSHRAKAIARTETTNAMNAGHDAAYNGLNDDGDEVIIGKQWADMEDEDVRSTHSYMNGIIVKPKEMFLIPVPDQDGNVTDSFEKALWPGHYELSPANRINCRCTTLGITKYDKAVDNWIKGGLLDLYGIESAMSLIEQLTT